jgi:hypothetical protein
MLSSPALDFISNEFPPGSLQFTTFETVNYKCFKEIFPKKSIESSWYQLFGEELFEEVLSSGELPLGRIALEKNCWGRIV